jgi:UDP-N-acetylmuramoyl-tripeptide--D-alanyl-D-alanine ligase
MNSTIQYIHSFIAKGATVSTDTRKIENASVFFALKGENFDANDFALQALEKGAAVAVVDKKELIGQPGCVYTPDVLTCLQDVARYHRSLFNIPVIGITGSNGKTTSKELLNAVLSTRYNTLCTVGNYNNHIGVPLTLLNMNEHHQVAIIEMGANHVGEIGFLCSIAQPTHGMITNIGKAHIEGFGSFENIIIAKTDLYRFLQQNSGKIFINSENQYLSPHVDMAECITYGAESTAHYKGKVISSSPFVEIEYVLPNNTSYQVMSQLLGVYNFENLMAAVAFGDYFEVPASDISSAIEQYSPNNSRSQLKNTQHNTIILDAYNANPTSMKAAIENFNQLNTTSAKGLVLGDMLEMGSTAAYEHQEIIRLIQSSETYKLVLLIGQEFYRLANPGDNIHYFPDTPAAALWLQENPPAGMTILIKGSRGIQLEKLEQYF